MAACERCRLCCHSGSFDASHYFRRWLGVGSLMASVHEGMWSNMPMVVGLPAHEYVMGGAPCEEVPAVVSLMQKLHDALQKRWPQQCDVGASSEDRATGLAVNMAKRHMQAGSVSSDASGEEVSSESSSSAES